MKFVIVLVALCTAVLSTIALPTPVSQRNSYDPTLSSLLDLFIEIVGNVVRPLTDFISVGKTKLHL
jgi:hypothetical protein